MTQLDELINTLTQLKKDQFRLRQLVNTYNTLQHHTENIRIALIQELVKEGYTGYLEIKNFDELQSYLNNNF